MTQSAIATLIVLAAAAWLLRRVYLTVAAAARGRPSNNLGGCGNCSRNPANEQTPVIKLGVQRPGLRSVGGESAGIESTGGKPMGSRPTGSNNRADSP